MKLISFSMTLDAFISGRKDVTRRVGWKNLKPGDRLMAVEKAQGLKRGEKVKQLGVIKVLDVRREPLNAITPDDVRREGFGDMKPVEFVRRFCQAHGTHNAGIEVARIEFRKVCACETECVAHEADEERPDCMFKTAAGKEASS